MEQITIAVLDFFACKVDIYHNVEISTDKDSFEQVEQFLTEKYGRTTDLQWMIADEGSITINDYKD